MSAEDVTQLSECHDGVPGAAVTPVSLKNLQQLRTFTLQNEDVVFVSKARIVYIIGEVRNQGSYTLECGMTMQQAMAAAGGATERADLSRFIVARWIGGSRSQVAATVDDILQPDDQITVGRRGGAPAR